MSEFARRSTLIAQRSTYYDILKDLRSYMCVEFLHDLASHHHEVLTEGGIGEAHVEYAATYLHTGGVASYDFAHHLAPAGYDAMLVEWSLESLFAQVLAQDGA